MQKSRFGSTGEPISLGGRAAVTPIRLAYGRILNSVSYNAYRTGRRVFINEAAVRNGLTPRATLVTQREVLLWGALRIRDRKMAVEQCVPPIAELHSVIVSTKTYEFALSSCQCENGRREGMSKQLDLCGLCRKRGHGVS
jgi:hypothetical protein